VKASLKSLAADMKPVAVKPVAVPAGPKAAAPKSVKSYRTAATRADTRQLSGHFPSDDVKAFRVLAAEHEMDVQELMAEALNMVFERYGKRNRIEISSGRRKRDA
jgi:hypothetical protein